MLFYLFLAFPIISLLWYVTSLVALKKIDHADPKSSRLGLSLVIPARNEDDNLVENIPIWLKQNHPNFEIIIVDDRSVDGTFDTIEALKQMDSRVKRAAVAELKNSSIIYGKKYALTLGIKMAQNEHVVFTDADCVPNDEFFLQRYDYAFSQGKNFVIGTGAFEKGKGFLNGLIRIDNQRIALLYFVFAKLGLPYMAVGRSMGYTKELFYAQKGFASHMNIASGDDDLFLQNSLKFGAKVGLAPAASTLSKTAPTFSYWKKQKTRHQSTGMLYPFRILAMLGLMDFASIASLGLIPFLWIFIPAYELIAIYLGVFLMKMAFFAINLFELRKLTKVNTQAVQNFLLEPFLSSLNALFSALTLVTKPNGWKTKI